LRVRFGGRKPPVLLLQAIHVRTPPGHWWRRYSPGRISWCAPTCAASRIVQAGRHAQPFGLVQARHDRGSYIALRAALDHPGAIAKLVVLDGVPILEALERCTERFARRWWHWFFYA
jgi:pimeloyl-ACP methyl ester carboxylesterase